MGQAGFFGVQLLAKSTCSEAHMIRDTQGCIKNHTMILLDFLNWYNP